MDAELYELMQSCRKQSDLPEGVRGAFVVSETVPGEIAVLTKDGERPYRLKPIQDLFASEELRPAAKRDLESDEYLPLCMAIEQTVLEFYNGHSELTDGQVQLAYDWLAAAPCDERQGSELLEDLRIAVRLQLSLRDYSKSEVVAVIRKLSRSVKRHTKLGGHRGYLEFLERYFAGYYGNADDSPW